MAVPPWLGYVRNAAPGGSELPDGFLLRIHKLVDAAERHLQPRLEAGLRKGQTLRGPLHFDEVPGVGRDDVHVRVGLPDFGTGAIEQAFALHDSGLDRGDVTPSRGGS